MNYYYDLEFLEGTQETFFGKSKPTIDIISIGIVSEDNREYYAISKDFNLKEAWNRYDLKYNQGCGDANNFPSTKVYWIRENVLRPIWKELRNPVQDLEDADWDKFTYRSMKHYIKKYGKSNKQIAEEVIKFTTPIVRSNVMDEIWSGEDGVNCLRKKDDSPITLYGYYSAYDHVALCWLFGKMIDLPKGFPMYTIDLQQESDRLFELKKQNYQANNGRGFILKMSNHPNYPKQTNEHNALADARWNKQLHEFLKQL